MTPSVPRIGFDRFIPMEWAEAALRVRAGTLRADDLDELLNSSALGAAAKVKTRTVLKRLWLEPRADLMEYADRGAEMFRTRPSIPVAALCWGMAVSTYPFFGKVAELVGRLSALQGDCASAEVHRRMSEIFGEREGTYRMTNMVLQTQAGWGVVERTNKGKRVVRLTPTVTDDAALCSWLIEAVARYAGRPIPVTGLQLQPVLFPFKLIGALSYVISSSPNLVLRSEGSGSQFVSPRLFDARI